MNRGLLIVFAIAVLQTEGTAADPVYKFEHARNKDVVIAQREKGRSVFVVTSKSGIGGVTISLTRGQWPRRVTLRLRYATGKGFKSLESLKLRTDRIQVEGMLKTSGKMPFRFLDRKGKPDAIQPEVEKPAGMLNVTAVVRDGGLDIALPTNLLNGTDKVKFTWVDAFR